MKNNFFFIIFLFILSCNPNKNFEISIDDLKKDGSTILTNIDLKNEDNEIFKINLVKLDNPQNVNKWNYSLYNSSNAIPHLNLSLNFSLDKKKNYFESKKNNLFYKQLIGDNLKIIYIDDYSNLFIINNENLKIEKKITLYKKKLIKNYALKFSILSINQVLYISDNLGSIKAIDLKSYKILWEKSLTVPFVSNLAFYKNSIYVTNSNGKLYSFQAKTGEQNWSFETGTNTIKNYNSYKISIDDNFLLFTNDLKYIYCLDLEKKAVIWNFKFKDLSSSNIETFQLSDLLMLNGSLYVSSTSGIFYKIKIQTGEVLWSNNIVTSTNFVQNLNFLAIVDKNGYFNIVDSNSGNILFKKNLANNTKSKKIDTNNFKLQNIFISSNKFYILTNMGHIISINSKNLQEIEYTKVANAINSNMILLNGSIFFIGDNEYLYKIK